MSGGPRRRYGARLPTERSSARGEAATHTAAGRAVNGPGHRFGSGQGWGGPLIELYACEAREVHSGQASGPRIDRLTAAIFNLAIGPTA